MQTTEFIWHKGELIAWQDANVHVMAHGLHYGSSIFEGIRVYDTHRGPAILCLKTHLKRFFDSAKIYRMEMPHNIEEITAACHEVVSINKLADAYIRPIAYRGFGSLKVYGDGSPVEVAVAAFPWSPYLGDDAAELGVDVGISSWTRMAPNTLPTMAKASGNYLSGQLISMEARRHGYAEGIALDVAGNISEGAGQNVFVVRDGKISTPTLASAVLPGITREMTIELAKQLCIEVAETDIPREMLHVADEIFMTGTATEIVPVRSVDGIEVGSGKRGPVTEKLQAAFSGLFDGSTEDRFGWLEVVEE